MKKRLLQLFALLLALTLAACSNNDAGTNDTTQQDGNSSGSEVKSGKKAKLGSGAHLVKFPKDLKKGIVFATYDRGSIHEDIYINSKEAIKAAQNGEEFPSGTVITLVGYNDGEIEQYLVMEKRKGWGSQYSPDERNGEWEYQHFNPDKKVAKDNIGRCLSCHASNERDDYINSMDQLQRFDLGKVSQSNNSGTETPVASIPTDDWKVSEISAHMVNSKHGNIEKSNEIDGRKKTKIIGDVLLRMYLQQYNS